MEDRLVSLLLHEIAVQKKLDGDLDADVPEGLQTWSLNEINGLAQLYEGENLLLSHSKRANEILNLIQQCKNWSKPEKERKWFHF